MPDSVSLNPQSGGVPVENVIGVFSPSSVTKSVPLDEASTSTQIAAPLAAPSPGQPVLQPSYLDFLKAIADAIQNHKEVQQQLMNVDVGISAKNYANFITGVAAVEKEIQDLLDAVQKQINAVNKIQNDVDTAYTTFAQAINAYNNGIDDTAEVNSVNIGINTFNSYQGLKTADYTALINANGGEDAVRNGINASFSTWNTFAGNYNGSLSTLQNNLQSAAQAWIKAVNDANAQLADINQKRTQSNQTPISLYPDPATTFTIPAQPPNLPTLSLIPSNENVGPNRTPIVPEISYPNRAVLVPLSALSLSSLPRISDVLNSDLFKSLVNQLSVFSVQANILSSKLQDVFAALLDPTNQGFRRLLPSAFIDKEDKPTADGGTSGSGIGQMGRPELEGILPMALWKSVTDIEKFPVPFQVVTSLKSEAESVLDKSAIAAAVPTAAAYGNKLANIDTTNSTYAIVLTSNIADNVLSATASNPVREIANILLKNLTGAATAAGIPLGKDGAPSAGEIAKASDNLAATFNTSLLGVTLAMLEKSLGFPGLAQQIIGNSEGLTHTDALPKNQTQTTTPALNQAVPNTIQPQQAAKALIDNVVKTNENILNYLTAQDEIKAKILEQIHADRDKIAAIIQESLQNAIRKGESNIELRDAVAASLQNVGYGPIESSYLSNQLINQISGNPVSTIAEGSTPAPMNVEELHQALSQHLDTVLTGLTPAKAGEIRDKVLVALLGGATPKEAMDVVHRNPMSVINQISDQKERLESNARGADREKIHEDFVGLLRETTRPKAELSYAISSMQDKPTTILNSISAAVQAVPSGDILSGGPV